MAFMAPNDCGFLETTINDQDPDQSLAIGIAGLTGANEPVCNYLCYQVLAIARAIGHDLSVEYLKDVIYSGQAIARWNDWD